MAYTPGELLVRDGAISAEAHRRALALRATEGGSLGECLVRLGIIDEQALAQFYHKRLVLPLVGPTRFSAIEPQILRLLPAEVATEFRVVPIAVDGEGSLLVAMADPSDNHAVEEIGFFVDRFVLRGVATESIIQRALDRYYKPKLARAAAPAPAAPASSQTPATRVPATQAPPFVAPAGASGRLPGYVAPEERTLFPENLEERAYDPFGPRARSALRVDEEVVVLTKKVRSDETPLPPHAPPPYAELIDDEPVLLTQARRKERRHTLPGMTPPPSARPPILALRAATDRDTVAQVILDYAAQLVGRATLFVVRKGVLSGFDARGGDLDRASVEVLQIPLLAPSLFREVTTTRLPFRGPLPDTPQNRTIARAMGTSLAADVMLCPIQIRDRVVAVLFADHITQLLPEAELQATLHEAGVAYARIIMQARANSEDLQR